MTSMFADRRVVTTWVLVIGVALGVAYAASPLTVWFAAAVIGIFFWAGAGLGDRERQWVWALLAVAIALRVIAVAALFATTDHHHVVSFFWDGDGIGLKRRAFSIRNVWLGIAVAPELFSQAFNQTYGWTTYLYVLAYLQYILGPSPYAVHLVNVGLFIASAVMLFRLARRSFGREAAFIGLAILLFLPTVFSWSVSALKESLYIFLSVAAVTATITLMRAGRFVRRVAAVLVLIAAVAVNNTVRTGALVIQVAGLLSGVLGSIIVRRISFVLLALMLIPGLGWWAATRTSIQDRVVAGLRSSASLHIGNVRTEGHGYKLLDQRFYSASLQGSAIPTMTTAEAGRFVIRAVVCFVVLPLPWQVQSLSELVFLPQQIAWYALVLLAAVGVVAGLRRDPLVTCVLTGVIAVASVIIALNSGNVGTMVRFRDTVVPFVVWFSALGGVALISRFSAHAPAIVPEERGQRAAN